MHRAKSTSPGAPGGPAELQTSHTQARPDGGSTIRKLRIAQRMPTHIRALIYRGRHHQSTVIRDLSRTGAGLDGAYGLMEGDTIVLCLLDGRSIVARVKWWLAGRCGIEFAQPLADDDALLIAAWRQQHPTAGDIAVSTGGATSGGAIGLQAVVGDDVAAADGDTDTDRAPLAVGPVSAFRIDFMRRLLVVAERCRCERELRQSRRNLRRLERACRDNGFAFLVEPDAMPLAAAAAPRSG